MNFNRNRRLRTSQSVRDLVRETTLTTNDFVLPIFVMEGSGKKRTYSFYAGCVQTLFRPFKRRDKRSL